MAYTPRTGPYVPNLGNFDTLAELLATHPATLYNPGTTAYAADQGIVVTNGSVWEDVGEGGSTALTAPTYAAARLLSGVATGDRLQVLGRTSQSDGGQGLFTWVAGGSTTINDGSQLSAPGGIWQRPDVTINAQWYGIDPTGVTASDVALNLAIQDAIKQKKKLIIPSGIFLLNAPLLCYQPGVAAFIKIDIEGQGGSIPGSSGFPAVPETAYQPNTILCMNSKLVPAIIYQAARYCSLKNLAIQGLNTTPFPGVVPPTDTRTDYIVSGCPTTFQSPYCAIAIDPFPASAPADGGYFGLGAQYGPSPSGTGSSGIVFENISIQEFVVGVALSTAGVSQGDNMIFRNVNIYNCETLYACGNSQSRNWCITGGALAFARQVIDTINYGTGTGTPTNPIVMENLLVVNVYRILALANQSPTLVKSMYAESFKTLGQFGKNIGGTPGSIIFEGCQWSLRRSWGSIPPIFFESPSPTTFKASYIYSDSNSTTDVWNIVCWGAQGGGCSIESCTFDGPAVVDLPPHIAIDFAARCGAHLKDCLSISGLTQFQISDDFLRNNGISYIANGKGRYRATWQSRTVADNNLTYNYQPANASPVIPCLCTGGSIVMTGTLAFTESVLGEVQVNDIIMWKMLAQGYSGNQWVVPGWKVASVDGSGNVVANPIWDIAQYDTVANTTAATYGANRVALVTHQWAPTTALTGNTHSNTTLDTLSSSALINGDWVQGVGIPANTRVVSGGGTASVVLSKAATSTLTGINLYDGQLVGAQQSGIYFPTQAGNTSTAPTPTFALGTLQAWTLSNNATWSAPTGAWVAGNRLTLLVTSTGAFTTAWNAVYRNAPAWAVAANGQKATAEFMYDGTNWQFIGGSTAFA